MKKKHEKEINSETVYIRISISMFHHRPVDKQQQPQNQQEEIESRRNLISFFIPLNEVNKNENWIKKKIFLHFHYIKAHKLNKLHNKKSNKKRIKK